MNGNNQVQKIPVDQALVTIATAVAQLKLSLDEHMLLQRCLVSLDELVKNFQSKSVEKVAEKPQREANPVKPGTRIITE